MENGCFYVVATPIGNLKDITLRAIEVLKSVDFIVCEDTRVTGKLLERYSIDANLFDCHKYNEKERSEKIIRFLKEGKDIAFVSDAGTPAVSDPGSVLYKELYKHNIKLIPVPGASAVTTLLSVLPRQNEFFTFCGFLSRNKQEQQKITEKYKDSTLVFYESPNRLLDTLDNIRELRGSDNMVSIGRELTKMFEEIKTGPIEEIIDYYSSHTLKGEIAVILYPQSEKEIEEQNLIEKIRLLKHEGFSDKDIAKMLSVVFDINKNKVYKLSISL